MEKTKFIFSIAAERQYNVMVRIMTSFNRQRIPILETTSRQEEGNGQLQITVCVEETKEKVLRLSKKLNNEIDIISVQLFEQCDPCLL